MNGLVLKASAGTGKTYRLSLEYLKALLNGESYEDILVMTFTIKATSEIKERIILFLDELYDDKKSELRKNLKELDETIELSEDNIKKVYSDVIYNKEQLKIFTIDGFINNIFRNVVASHLNIFSYDVISDDENKKILLKCFEKAIENKEYFFKFEKFLKNRTKKNIDDYLDVIKKIVENKWQLIMISQSTKIKSKEEYIFSDNIESLLNEMLNQIKKCNELKSPEKNLIDSFKGKFKWIAEEDSSLYKENLLNNWNEFMEDVPWNRGSVKSTKQFNLDVERKGLETIYNKLKFELSKKIFNSEILPTENEILEFIKTIHSIYDGIKFKEQKFTHNDISNYVFEYMFNTEMNLISDRKITEYFKEILESEFKTIFIDEFQDTSILQWNILKGIVNDCENFICVGDEKQSIYSWRSGEKALFENMSNILNIEENYMNVSYRSYENIITFTNDIFSKISEIHASNNRKSNINAEWNFKPITGKKDMNDPKGYYEILSPENVPKDEILEIMVDSIYKNFNKNYSNVAIIARTNKQLKKIAEVLDKKHLPYTLNSDEPIKNHKAVAPIFNLLTFLVNKDLFSLLVFLRSDLIKLGNRELKIILKNQDAILSYIFKNEKLNLNKEDDIIEILFRIQKIAKKTLTNKNLILDIISEFNVTEKFSKKYELANIFKFLEISKNYSNNFDFYNVLNDEIKTLEFKQISSETENAIILITIHKSKGLEFETVYYYHDKKKNPSDKGIQFYVDIKYPFDTVENFIFTEKKYEKILKNLGDDYKYLKELEIKEEQENINSVYVALTRAKKNLFLIFKDNKKEEDSESLEVKKYFKEMMLKYEKSQCGIIDKVDGYEQAIPTTENLEFINSLNLIEKDIEKIEYSPRDKFLNISMAEKRCVGLAIHYYLEFIKTNEQKEHIEATERTYSKFASTVGIKKLKNILDSRKFKLIFDNNPKIFSNDWDYIYSEYEIYTDNGLKRIDRLMIKKYSEEKNGEILIVDYKTGETDQEQLYSYIDLIERHLEKIGEKNKYIVTGEFLQIKL